VAVEGVERTSLNQFKYLQQKNVAVKFPLP
jgi:hypothetical protein